MHTMAPCSIVECMPLSRGEQSDGTPLARCDRLRFALERTELADGPNGPYNLQIFHARREDNGCSMIRSQHDGCIVWERQPCLIFCACRRTINASSPPSVQQEAPKSFSPALSRTRFQIARSSRSSSGSGFGSLLYQPTKEAITSNRPRPAYHRQFKHASSRS